MLMFIRCLHLQVQLELAERAADAGAAALQAGDWELAAGAAQLTSCVISTRGELRHPAGTECCQALENDELQHGRAMIRAVWHMQGSEGQTLCMMAISQPPAGCAVHGQSMVRKETKFRHLRPVSSCRHWWTP